MSAKYKPDLFIKRLSELAKVRILEEAVQKGTLQDVEDVINTYKTFEMTARALGLAARYRGIEFVVVLAKNKATFKYKRDSIFKGKYKVSQPTTSWGSCWTNYCFMIIPNKLELTADKWGSGAYQNSGLCRIHDMDISKELVSLSFEKRIEIARYFIENKDLGATPDGMLYWALTNGEIEFADALIDIGVSLRDDEPEYMWKHYGYTYIDVITTASNSKYWKNYVESIVELKEEKLGFVLERFDKLVKKAGKKLTISQRMIEDAKWSSESLSYVLKNADLSKINQKKTLKKSVSKNDVEKLAIMADADWLRVTKKEKD